MYLPVADWSSFFYSAKIKPKTHCGICLELCYFKDIHMSSIFTLITSASQPPVFSMYPCRLLCDWGNL